MQVDFESASSDPDVQSEPSSLIDLFLPMGEIHLKQSSLDSLTHGCFLRNVGEHGNDTAFGFEFK